jgi:hypothetical protein
LDKAEVEMFSGGSTSRRPRKIAIVLTVGIALTLGGIGIQSASASTRPRLPSA